MRLTPPRNIDEYKVLIFSVLTSTHPREWTRLLRDLKEKLKSLRLTDLFEKESIIRTHNQILEL